MGILPSDTSALVQILPNLRLPSPPPSQPRVLLPRPQLPAQPLRQLLAKQGHGISTATPRSVITKTEMTAMMIRNMIHSRNAARRTSALLHQMMSIDQSHDARSTK